VLLTGGFHVPGVPSKDVVGRLMLVIEPSHIGNIGVNVEGIFGIMVKYKESVSVQPPSFTYVMV
jgi:hypothetical protein